jgi:hypothetical protein
MPKLKTPKKPEDKTPVFTWGFKSSKAPLVGGVTFDYVAQLNQDGTVSCNCPGWRFVKKGQQRRCRHTDAVQGEAPAIMEAWRDGKTFELKEFSAPQAQATVPSDVTSTKKAKPKQGTLKFNRVVEY